MDESDKRAIAGHHIVAAHKYIQEHEIKLPIGSKESVVADVVAQLPLNPEAAFIVLKNLCDPQYSLVREYAARLVRSHALNAIYHTETRNYEEALFSAERAYKLAQIVAKASVDD